jgi:hypothetical protein
MASRIGGAGGLATSEASGEITTVCTTSGGWWTNTVGKGFAATLPRLGHCGSSWCDRDLNGVIAGSGLAAIRGAELVYGEESAVSSWRWLIIS